MYISLRAFIAVAAVGVIVQAWAQQDGVSSSAVTNATEKAEAAYTREIEGRTKGILTALGLEDAAKPGRVHDVIMAQYRGLRAWHDANDGTLKEAGTDKGKVAEIQATLRNLHEQFISKLSADLTAAQVEKVKDKMTYNKVQVTYDSYCQIVHNLTDAEKARMMELLKEAREEAMDCGSADEKSAVFKRYKGKINNYLTAQGHDVGKAHKDWGEKQRAKPVP